MTYKRQDFLDKLERLVRSKDEMLDEFDAPDALDSAVVRYSRDRAKIVVQEYTGTGDRLYPLPAQWVEDFSVERYKVEYPVDVTAYQQQWLDQQMCEVYATPTGPMLRFRGTVSTNYVPASGETFRVHYSVPRTLDDSTCDIPSAHFLPVCHLAAHYLCKVLQARYAQQSDQIGTGQLADFRSKDQKFNALADQYLAMYKSVVIPAAADVRAAFSFGEFEGTPLHREKRPSYPEDNSGRTFVDV